MMHKAAVAVRPPPDSGGGSGVDTANKRVIIHTMHTKKEIKHSGATRLV